VIVPFNAGYAMSSKLISEIGSRGRLSARAERSECMTGGIYRSVLLSKGKEKILGDVGFVVELDATRRTDSSVLALAGYQ
jgi:hypothetical protein